MPLAGYCSRMAPARPRLRRSPKPAVLPSDLSITGSLAADADHPAVDTRRLPFAGLVHRRDGATGRGGSGGGGSALDLRLLPGAPSRRAAAGLVRAGGAWVTPLGPLADELAELNRPVKQAVVTLANRLYGKRTRRALDHTLLAVFDLPYGATKRHLVAGTKLPVGLRRDLEIAVRAVLGAPLLGQSSSSPPRCPGNSRDGTVAGNVPHDLRTSSERSSPSPRPA